MVLHLRDKMPKRLALKNKNNGAVVHKTYTAVMNWEMSPKGLVPLDSPAPRPCSEAADYAQTLSEIKVLA